VVAALVMLLSLFGMDSFARAAGTLTVNKTPIANAGTVTGSGINCGPDCTQFYSNVCEPNPAPPPACFFLPPDVDLTASTNAGFQFQSWTGCDSASGTSCTMTMTTNKTLTANYQDVQDPIASLTGPDSGAVVSGVVNLTATASDNWGIDRVDFRINGNLVGTDGTEPYSVSWNSATIPDSTGVQIGAQAVDLAGRMSLQSIRTITVDNPEPPPSYPEPPPNAIGDTTPPDTLITSGPKDKTKKKTATFTFTGTDTRAVAGFRCKLDEGTFAPCTSPHTVKVKKGKHTFQVQAIDQAGNTGPPATDDWKVKKKRRK
jgi:Bacterial Ig domain/Divergent InlB B-repeat domain